MRGNIIAYHDVVTNIRLESHRFQADGVIGDDAAVVCCTDCGG